MQAKILVTDDDPQIREVLRIALERAGYATVAASDGRAALASAATARPDLIVLDIGLPEMDGLEVCRRLRASSQVPILFLTARDDEIDRILGLELGADDYVTKPFSPREVVARIRAILKRAGHGPVEPRLMRHGVIELDPAAYDCRVAGDALKLTATEHALLSRLIRRPEEVVTRRQLADALYGANSAVSDRTVDSHFRNLRRKLSDAGCADPFETLHGIGIRMGPCAKG
ncbi:response regulator transcription factor [Defluviimonas sp. WL0050]|uniref:Response regulator transcription factor n=1 Tax=Albidovulum litorale TaxID=2984134 RepID=A0ABT2ZIE9_9RHOB|nr:response regulator transcription factor [Defluviimonas sp. WL0050]MCV2870915.1 response regulator transcription factor [Defluviimonas sp. WL0050]